MRDGVEVYWEVRGPSGRAAEVISPLWLLEAAEGVAAERLRQGRPAAVWEVRYDRARRTVLEERRVREPCAVEAA